MVAINANRLWERHRILSEFTEPDQPWTRRAFSPVFVAAREWLSGEFRDAGLDVEVDAGGNLVGRRKGSNPALKPIIMGSHIDTVLSGGRYDGILGVLAALEVVQCFAEGGHQTRHAIEVRDWLSEEPSDFGLSGIGSRAFAGALTEQHLALKRADGLTLRDALCLVGGRPDDLTSTRRNPGDTAAYVELHIEQGRVLEEERVRIGVVTNIVGIRRDRITFKGRADHAGATPMNLRRDALVAAARFIDRAYCRALALSLETPIVATIGHVAVSPNMTNVVPGEVILLMEVRSGDDTAMEGFIPSLIGHLDQEFIELRVSVESEPISIVPPTPCAPQIQDAIKAAATLFQLSSRPMPSGAGHDGIFVARTGPIGMIFVPCLDGRSHAPEESIEPEQAVEGAKVMAETVLKLDADLR